MNNNEEVVNTVINGVKVYNINRIPKKWCNQEVSTIIVLKEGYTNDYPIIQQWLKLHCSEIKDVWKVPSKYVWKLMVTFPNKQPLCVEFGNETLLFQPWIDELLIM